MPGCGRAFQITLSFAYDEMVPLVSTDLSEYTVGVAGQYGDKARSGSGRGPREFDSPQAAPTFPSPTRLQESISHQGVVAPAQRISD